MASVCILGPKPHFINEQVVQSTLPGPQNGQCMPSPHCINGQVVQSTLPGPQNGKCMHLGTKALIL